MEISEGIPYGGHFNYAHYKSPKGAHALKVIDEHNVHIMTCYIGVKDRNPRVYYEKGCVLAGRYLTFHQLAEINRAFIEFNKIIKSLYKEE